MAEIDGTMEAAKQQGVDVASMVGFLVSDEANFITGQAYNVNGGLLFH